MTRSLQPRWLACWMAILLLPSTTQLAAQTPVIQTLTPATNIQVYKHGCYKSLGLILRNYGPADRGYAWGVKVINNYPKGVSLRYQLVVGGVAQGPGTLTPLLNPGQAYSVEYAKEVAIAVNTSANTYYIDITEVCFQGQNCPQEGYADCSGQPAQAQVAKSNSPAPPPRPTAAAASQPKSATSQPSSALSSTNPAKSTADISKASKTAPVPAADADTQTFSVVQRPASFVGGLDAWKKYLERNLNAQLPSENGAPPGIYTVVVSFIVDKEGNISEVKAENNPGYGTADEAVRLIRRGPAWQPAWQNGRHVTFRQRQSISFQVSAE